MILHTYYLSLSDRERETLARKAGTNLHYLYKLSRGYKTPSLKLAQRLIELVPGLTHDAFIEAHAKYLKGKSRRASRKR